MSLTAQRHDLLGIPIAHLSAAELVDWAETASLDPVPQTCFGVNTHSVTVAAADLNYAEALRSCSAVLCDGIGVQAAARLLPGPVPERLIITNYHDEIHARLAKRNDAVFILGYEAGIAQQAADAVKRRHPGLREVGYHDGYFTLGSDQEVAVINAIRDVAPSVLWVGMATPVRSCLSTSIWNSWAFRSSLRVARCGSTTSAY